MTDIERLLLFDQFNILANQANSEGDTLMENRYRKNAEIVSNGYTGLYDDFFNCLYTEMPESEIEFVFDVLDMYGAMYFAYSRNGKNVEDIRFRGFDGNHEIRFKQCCIFILKTLNRFGELQIDPKDEYNAHCEMTPKYKRMLATWMSYENKYDLSVSEVEEICKS